MWDFSDTLGTFHVTLHRSNGAGYLQFNKAILPGSYTTNVNLQNNYNYHKVNVTLALLSPNSFIPIEGEEIELKVERKPTLYGLSKASDKTNSFFELLEKAKVNQPYFRNYFSKLETLIKEKSK